MSLRSEQSFASLGVLKSLILSDCCDVLSFQPSLDNIHALVHSFTNSSQARREGLKFQDVVYECVRADRFSVYAKHVSETGNYDAIIN